MDVILCGTPMWEFGSPVDPPDFRLFENENFPEMKELKIMKPGGDGQQVIFLFTKIFLEQEGICSCILCILCIIVNLKNSPSA